jgi:tetratricopeptide (TPR) repeat protein
LNPEFRKVPPSSASVVDAALKMEQSGKATDGLALDALVEVWQQVVHRSGFRKSPNAFQLDALDHAAAANLRAYVANRSSTNLGRSCRYWRRAVALSPLGWIRLARYHSNLAYALRLQFLLTRRGHSLNESIVAGETALQIGRTRDPRYGAFLSNLGLALKCRYDHKGNEGDLNRAIELLKRASRRSGQDQLVVLNNLVVVYLTRYKQTFQPADLTAAIAHAESLVARTDLNAYYAPQRLGNLARGLTERFLLRGLPSDLNRALELHQLALSLDSSLGHRDSGRLCDYATTLRTLFHHSGDVAALDHAVLLHEDARSAARPGSDSEVIAVNQLCIAVRQRYLLTGRTTDLEFVTTHLNQALARSGLGNVLLGGLNTNLGTAFFYRYQRFGKLADLDKAIQAWNNAIAVAPGIHPARLNNVAVGLFSRYQRDGDEILLENALSAWKAALRPSRLSKELQAQIQSNIGMALRSRHRSTRCSRDIDDAIAAHEKALELTPSSSSAFAPRLINCGNALTDRYGRTANPLDISESLRALRKALRCLDDSSPQIAICGTNLGNAFWARYQRRSHLRDARLALDSWIGAWDALQRGGLLLRFPDMVALQRVSTDLLENLMTGFADLEKHSAARKCESWMGMNIAENAKSVALTSQLSRGALPPPQDISPELLSRERAVLDSLTSLDATDLAAFACPGLSPTESLAKTALRERQVIELEVIWKDIEQTGDSGSKYVSLRRGTRSTATPFAEALETASAETAFVSLAKGFDNTLLFVVRPGWNSPRVFQSDMSHGEWLQAIARLRSEFHQPIASTFTWDDSITPLLKQATPYLDGIDEVVFAPQGDGHQIPWPFAAARAGWCPRTSDPPSFTVIPALRLHRQLPQAPFLRPESILIVGDPRGDLIHARSEAIAVARTLNTEPLLGKDATKAKVLAQIQSADYIHFATHARFEPSSPLDSWILLSDGQITARELIGMGVSPRLVVMSACESGLSAPLGGDEIAGLVSAFLYGGTGSLVVSLWEVDDESTASLMMSFARQLAAGVPPARALGLAASEVKENVRWQHPYFWSSFVCVG